MASRPLKLKNPNDDADALDDIASAGLPSLPPEGDLPIPIDDNERTPGVTQMPVNQGAVVKNTVVKNIDADKKALEGKAKEFGKADGAGKRAFVQFARLLVQGGASEVLSPSAKGQDASNMYKAFNEASKSAAGGLTTDEKKSQSAQLSKVRAFIRLGAKLKDTAEKVFDDALDVHKHIMATPELSERAKLRSTYAAACSIAVAQCKPEQNAVPLTPTQMQELLLNAPVEEVERTGAHVLISALNLVESAMRGKATTEKSMGRAPVTHPHIVPAPGDAYGPISQAIIGVITSLPGGPELLTDRDAEIERIKKEKAEAAEKKAAKEKADAEKKAAKEKEAAIQANLAPTAADLELANPDDEDTFDPEAEGVDTTTDEAEGVE